MEIIASVTFIFSFVLIMFLLDEGYGFRGIMVPLVFACLILLGNTAIVGSDPFFMLVVLCSAVSCFLVWLSSLIFLE